MEEIVGRDSELEAIGAFLHGEGARPRVLVLEGEAGIGKTTVWEEATRAARTDFRVLVSRPLPVESRISYAAADDLLSGLHEEVLCDLPEPQRHALEAALLLAEPGRSPPRPQAIAFAFLSALNVLARRAPLLIAIDDIQWLDRPSSAVVAYAARRIRDQPVWLLLATRTGSAIAPIGRVATLTDGVPIERLEIGPLSFGGIQRLLREKLGKAPPRALMRRIHEASRGNPFYALELARALAVSGGTVRLDEPLPLSPTLDDVIATRLAALPEATLRALETAALTVRPTLSLLEKVSGERCDVSPAVTASIATINDDRLSFSHPLFATWIAKQMDGPARAALHRRLAEVVCDPEERAHHLALGITGPDPDVAAQLAAAARIARARGSPSASAMFLEHSLRLSADGAPDVRVTLDAADAHFEAGATPRAIELLEVLARALPHGNERARVLSRLAAAKGEVGPVRESVRLSEQALEEVEEDAALESRIQSELSWMAIFAHDLPKALEHARRAVELSERLETAVRVEALAALAYMEFTAGLPFRGELIEHALALERLSDHVRIDRSPTVVRGFQLLWSGQLAEARSCFEKSRRLALERGDESQLSISGYYLAVLEIVAGNWTTAAGHVRECGELADQTGVNRPEAAYASALLDAHLGRAELAVTGAERLLGRAEQEREALYILRGLGLLGFVELSRGDLGAAVVRLARAAEVSRELGIGQPGLLRFMPDQVEALVGLGRTADAESALAPFEEAARLTGHPWALATVDRCRGLIRAAADDLPGGLAILERARAAFEQLPFPFELGRTLLVLGIAERRAKQRGRARATLEAAVDAFERLPAPLWSDRARVELARISGRTGARGDLTPQERRIAELVAAGGSNAEVGAALFVTVNTVEGALTRAYRKLGIRSRTELANRLAETVPKL